MHLDGTQGDAQPFSNILIPFSFDEEAQDLKLSFGELHRKRRADTQRRCGVRENTLACHGSVKECQEFLLYHRLVPKAINANGSCSCNIGVFGLARDNDDFDIGIFLLDSLGGINSVGIHCRANVHQNEVNLSVSDRCFRKSCRYERTGELVVFTL